MQYSKDDFPLYVLLERLRSPGFEDMQADFAAAQEGGDEELYYFALGIQTVPRNVKPSQIPGCNQDMMDKTMATCFEIFSALAEKGHEGGAYMVNDFVQNGLNKPSQRQGGFGR